MATSEVLAKTIFTIHSNNRFMTDKHNGKFVSDDQNYVTDTLDCTSSDEDPEGTPAPTCSRYLRITTDHEPKDPRCGFVFGSDRDVCDILLDARQRNGVSRKQFAIMMRWDNSVLILKNHSRNGTMVSSGSENPDTIKSQRAILDEVTVTGSFHLQIKVPDHRQHQAAFTANWEGYRARIASSVPSLTNLDIESGPSVTKALDFPDIPQHRLQLGRGHSGTVYKAVDRFNGNLFAVKVFKADRSNTKTYGEIFREALVLQSISHEHIVKFHVFTIVKETKEAMLVMEHVEGRNLAEEHEAENIQLRELRTITQQLLKALAYIHANGIAHRDIKPLNVIVSSRNPIYVKLVDFGMASRDTLRTFCGTSFYAAPEVYDIRTDYNDACYTSKVDIWALGVMFLELAYGFPSEVETRAKHFDHPRLAACILEHLASQDQDIVAEFASSLLIYVPNERPTAMESLTHTFLSPDAPIPHLWGPWTPKYASMNLTSLEPFAPLTAVSDMNTVVPTDLLITTAAGPSQDTRKHSLSVVDRDDLQMESKQTQSSPTTTGGLLDGTGVPAEGRPKAKRKRFSASDIAVLEEIYQRNHFPKKETILEEASGVSLSYDQIRAWFYRRRR